MKQFESIKQAYYYVTNCPICDVKMEVNDRDVTFVSKNGNNYLYFKDYSLKSKYLNQEYQVRINLKTREVECFGDLGKTSKMWARSQIECPNCCKYYYMLQFVFDLTNKRIDGIFLNSEFIAIELKDKSLHEIKNFYGMKKTSYDYYPMLDKDGTIKHAFEKKSADFPLMPLNINKPEETLDRIKKLLIFT